MKIVVDAFGGDNSPEEVIYGTVDALNENKDFTAVLVGKRDRITEILSTLDFDEKRVEIVSADDVITCEEEPVMAVRRKPNSSICVAYKIMTDDPEAKAFVSAGSTGAVLVGATLKLGRVKGINRPALCPILPTVLSGKKVLLLDAGANADCKPINLCQFALMGSIFSRLSGVENPKVALLSNGTEDEKGNALNHEVFPMLKEMKGINFVGNTEARDILSGKYDVVVADGFSGNIALKSSEGTAKLILKSLKNALSSSLPAKLGGLLSKKALRRVKDEVDYHNKGGALLLGLEKAVIKVHGSAKRMTIKSAVLQAVDFAAMGVVDAIKEKITEIPMGEGV